MSAVAAAHGVKLGGRELALLCQKVEVRRMFPTHVQGSVLRLHALAPAEADLSGDR